MTDILSRTINTHTLTKAKPLTTPFFLSLSVFFLIAMHYFQHNAGGAGLELSFNAAAWIPLGVSLSLGLFEIARQKRFRYSRLTQLLFGACLLLTAPIFYPNAHIEGALLRLLGLWGGFLFFLCLQQFAFTIKQKQNLLWLIVFAVLIESIIGWGQFLLLEPNNFMGYDTQANRPYGIFQQPNVMASFLATGLILAGYLLPRQAHLNRGDKLKYAILLITPLVTIPLIIIIGSRTGWLGAGLGLLLLIPYYHQFASRHQKTLEIGAIFLGLLLAWTITSTDLNPNTAQQAKARVEAKFQLQTARSTIYPQAWNMFLEKPWTGYGYGLFESSYLLQTAQWHQDDPQNNRYGLAALDHPHNEPLYWAVEGGIIPIIGLILATSAILWRIKKAKKGTQLALIALITPLILHSQLEYPFYHSIAHWITLLILIYWIDNLTTKHHKHALQYVLLLRVFAFILPVFIGLFMITTLYSGYQLTRFETQRNVDISPLLKVNNPWAWQNRFEWDLHLLQLQLGKATKQTELINQYINWAEQKAKVWPRVSLYRNLLLAHQLLNQLDAVENLKYEAEFLFPNQKFQRKTDIKPIDS
jgi:O-antigen polymerase